MNKSRFTGKDRTWLEASGFEPISCGQQSSAYRRDITVTKGGYKHSVMMAVWDDTDGSKVNAKVVVTSENKNGGIVVYMTRSARSVLAAINAVIRTACKEVSGFMPAAHLSELLKR